MQFQIGLTSEFAKEERKKERKKKESVVKYTSADNYVGRPNTVQ